MARTNNASQPRHASGKQKKARQGAFDGPRSIVLPRLMLLFSVFALMVIGLVMVFSTTSVEAINAGTSPVSEVIKHFAIALVGSVVCYALARFVPYYVWLGPALWVVWGGVVVLLLATALFGVVGLGAQRWLDLGPISFQPSELAKPAFILMSARVMYKARVETYSLGKFSAMMIGFVLAPLGLLYFSQSDLGTAAICLIGLLAVLWLADVSLRVFFATMALIAVFGVVSVLAKGYRASRLAFLNPFADKYGDGWQLVQSFYSFAEGGLFGVGLGNSAHKYQYLPEAETDFIFAIIGEELGLVGAVAVIVLFVIFLWAGLRIARTAPDLFGTMVAGGCTVMVVFQAFLNMGCVTGVLPVTGKPLPFISSGGTSLLGSLLLVALILSVSFGSGSTSGVYEKRRNDLSIVRAQPYPARSGASRHVGGWRNAASSTQESTRRSSSNETRTRQRNGSANKKR